MVGAGRVAEGGPDAPEPLGPQLVLAQMLLGRVPLVPRPLVEGLGERLGEPVGERLDDDRAVVVVLRLVAPGELVRAVDADREGADGVAGRRDEVCERVVRTAVRVVRLLTEEVEGGVADDDVVALAPGRLEAVDPPRL